MLREKAVEIDDRIFRAYLWVYWCMARSRAAETLTHAIEALCANVPIYRGLPHEPMAEEFWAGFDATSRSLWVRLMIDPPIEEFDAFLRLRETGRFDPKKMFLQGGAFYENVHGFVHDSRFAHWQTGELDLRMVIKPGPDRQVLHAILTGQSIARTRSKRYTLSPRPEVRPHLGGPHGARDFSDVRCLGALMVGYDAGIAWLGSRDQPFPDDYTPAQRARRLRVPEGMIRPFENVAGEPEAAPRTATWWPFKSVSEFGLAVSLPRFWDLAHDILLENQRSQVLPSPESLDIILATTRVDERLRKKLQKRTVAQFLQQQQPRALLVAAPVTLRELEEAVFCTIPHALPPGLTVHVFSLEHLAHYLGCWIHLWAKYYDRFYSFSLLFPQDKEERPCEILPPDLQQQLLPPARVLITGRRQTGKSTAVRQLIARDFARHVVLYLKPTLPLFEQQWLPLLLYSVFAVYGDVDDFLLVVIENIERDPKVTGEDQQLSSLSWANTFFHAIQKSHGIEASLILTLRSTARRRAASHLGTLLSELGVHREICLDKVTRKFLQRVMEAHSKTTRTALPPQVASELLEHIWLTDRTVGRLIATIDRLRALGVGEVFVTPWNFLEDPIAEEWRTYWRALPTGNERFVLHLLGVLQFCRTFRISESILLRLLQSFNIGDVGGLLGGLQEDAWIERSDGYVRWDLVTVDGPERGVVTPEFILTEPTYCVLLRLLTAPASITNDEEFRDLLFRNASALIFASSFRQCVVEVARQPGSPVVSSRISIEPIIHGFFVDDLEEHVDEIAADYVQHGHMLDCVAEALRALIIAASQSSRDALMGIEQVIRGFRLPVGIVARFWGNLGHVQPSTALQDMVDRFRDDVFFGPEADQALQQISNSIAEHRENLRRGGAVVE
jgi:hypothetical protein